MVTEDTVMVSVGGKQPYDESIRSGNVVQEQFVMGEFHDIK